MKSQQPLLKKEQKLDRWRGHWFSYL